MLPLLKILTVLFKVFSKPMINHTKKYHIARNKRQLKPTYSKMFFVSFGNYIHIFESKVNRKFLNISDDIPFKMKTLKDEDALEKGLEYFYEIVFYTFLIILPLFEMYRANKDAKVKSLEISKKLQNIETKIIDTKDSFIDESHKISGKLNGLQSQINSTDKTLLDVIKSQVEQRNSNNEEIKQAFSSSKVIIDDIIKGGKQFQNMLQKLNKQQEKINVMISQHENEVFAQKPVPST